jgi:hypothetical protein
MPVKYIADPIAFVKKLLVLDVAILLIATQVSAGVWYAVPHPKQTVRLIPVVLFVFHVPDAVPGTVKDTYCHVFGDDTGTSWTYEADELLPRIDTPSVVITDEYTQKDTVIEVAVDVPKPRSATLMPSNACEKVAFSVFALPVKVACCPVTVILTQFLNPARVAGKTTC